MNDHDRISLLPDSLLHDILSFLDSKQVVQTCVLSKRWETLWTHIPTLNFDYNYFSSEPSSIDSCYSFDDYIFRVLSERHRPRQTNIQKLSYSCLKWSEAYSKKSWIRNVELNMLQELHITAFEVGEWTQGLATCKLLTVLNMTIRLMEEDFDLESLMLPGLRILVIKRTLNDWDEYDDYDYDYGHDSDYDYNYGYKGEDDVGLNEKTLSGYPSLECLSLINCLLRSSACICALKLENLEISTTDSESDLVFPEVELRTPNLRSVKFNNTLPYVKSASDMLCIDKVTIIVDDFSKYFEGGVYIKQKMEMNISQLLGVFHNTRSLTLPSKSLEVIYKLAPSLCGCSFHNLRHLKFKRQCANEMMIEVQIGPNTISNFIECPNLESFVVDSTLSESLSQLNLQH